MAKKPKYPFLEAEISKCGFKKKEIAAKLDISPRAFSQKLTGATGFWWSEVQTIHALFPNTSIDVLFDSSDD